MQQQMEPFRRWGVISAACMRFVFGNTSLAVVGYLSLLLCFVCVLSSVMFVVVLGISCVRTLLALYWPCRALGSVCVSACT